MEQKRTQTSKLLRDSDLDLRAIFYNSWGDEWGDDDDYFIEHGLIGKSHG